MIIAAVIPTTSAANQPQGFDRGVSWKPYVPLKRMTFVQFDSETLLDDYAYLAAVPTAVFYDNTSQQIYSNPLLYYEDPYQVTEQKERSLNTYEGIEYFMEDWMSYSHGYLDQLTLINVPHSKIASSWSTKNTTLIEAVTPYDVAGDLALHDWSYSENAVVAVIQDSYEKPQNTTEGTITGTLSKRDGILTEHFEIPKTNEVYPIYNEFTVPEGYKFLTVRSWYPSFYFNLGIPGFEGLINMSIPAGDRDLQIYCEKNGQWMMAGITNAWNAKEGMDHDKTSVYVYNSGKWSVALTDVPTKSLELSGLISTKKTGYEVQKHRSFLGLNFGHYGRLIDIIKNMRQVTYQVDVNMYPGITVDIPDQPPYNCRDVFFELTWDDPSASLGFSLIGPSGEEVLSTRESGVSSTCELTESEDVIPLPAGTTTDMHLERLGECLPGEQYSLCVFSMNDLADATDFTIRYSWQQNMTRMEGDGLASATEGAVLASVLNAPLLYTQPDMIPTSTQETLTKLGVKHLSIVDLGGHLSTLETTQLSMIAPIQTHYTTYDAVYDAIRTRTGSNDVIFSTVDPWSYWYVGEFQAAGEYPGAFAIGPAAYLAAHHGSPVLLIDNHPELSSAVVWHTEFWRRHPDGISKLPTVSEMYLTGTRVYSFLEDHGFDKEGDETIVTLGGQFDIGLTWDRVFVGKAKPGRFIDSPTDISVWIVKNVFYPQLVFENPALKNPTGLSLINGSSSERRFPSRGKFGLKITKESGEETFEYPVLDTLICYDHKFNSRASKYWGFTYKTADGTVPGITPSFEPIDEGVMVAVNGQQGGFFPDLSGSEVQPFYLRQAGYDPVFSTNFEANMYDLNQGVLLWMINTHGAPLDGGMLMFWDVTGENPQGYPAIPFAGYKKETNPWRGYEWLEGSTEEPDTMTMEIHGILPAIAGNPNPRGVRFFTTAFDWALAKRPIRDFIGKLANLPLVRLIAPEWLKDTQDYYDGIIISVFLGRFGTSWYNGTQIDDALGNIHSTGVSSVACLPAGKYLHIALMRHGSVFQIMDPWATSWYSDVWQNSIPRGIAMGETIGEIYADGISHVGILYISEPPQWWWDLAENVCLYGDPNLRIWAPSTEFSIKNHWDAQDIEPLRYTEGDSFDVAGHMPFGVTAYTNARTPASLWSQYSYILIGIIVLIVLIIIIIFSIRKRQE